MDKKKELKTAKINFRIKPSEYKVIFEKAEALGMDMSEYIRLTALHSDISIKYNK